VVRVGGKWGKKGVSVAAVILTKEATRQAVHSHLSLWLPKHGGVSRGIPLAASGLLRKGLPTCVHWHRAWGLISDVLWLKVKVGGSRVSHIHLYKYKLTPNLRSVLSRQVTELSNYASSTTLAGGSSLGKPLVMNPWLLPSFLSYSPPGWHDPGLSSGPAMCLLG
jgi:hypothetical protein